MWNVNCTYYTYYLIFTAPFLTNSKIPKWSTDFIVRCRQANSGKKGGNSRWFCSARERHLSKSAFVKYVTCHSQRAPHSEEDICVHNYKRYSTGLVPPKLFSLVKQSMRTRCTSKYFYSWSLQCLRKWNSTVPEKPKVSEKRARFNLAVNVSGIFFSF